MHSLHKPPHELSSSENGEPGVLDWIRSKRIDLVINIPEGTTKTDEVTAGYLMRRAAVDFGASLLTNIKYVSFNSYCIFFSVTNICCFFKIDIICFYGF